MKKPAAIALAISLAFQGANAAARPLADSEIRDMKAIVSSMLKDPESARWSFPGDVGISSYCGFVNAKNSYGGYVGWTAFRVKVDYKQNNRLLMETLEMDDLRGLTVAGPLDSLCRTLGYHP